MTETSHGQLIPADLIDRMEAEQLDLETRRTRQSLTRAQAKLRQTINGGGLVYRIGYCIDVLARGSEEGTVMGERQQVPLDAVRVGSLKASLDGSLRLLDKLLPSLKAIEVQGDITAGATIGGTTIQIVTAVPRDPNTPQQPPISFA